MVGVIVGLSLSECYKKMSDANLKEYFAIKKEVQTPLDDPTRKWFVLKVQNHSDGILFPF